MKLNTLLKITTPITTIGVITPILTSCGGNSFSFEYADEINCLAKDGTITYHSIKQVGNAVKKLVKYEQTPRGMTLEEANTLLAGDGYQNVYFDLIASYTLLDNKGLKLDSWNYVDNTFTFNFEDENGLKPITNANAQYVNGSGDKFYLSIGNGAITCLSFTLSLVTYKP